MKKLFILLFVPVAILSCDFRGGGFSIKHSQYDHYYEMTAEFNPDNTAKLEAYLDKELTGGTTLFTNLNFDDDVFMADSTTFHVKKSPGYLNILFDKEKNSEQAFNRVKAVLDGVGEVVR